MKLLPEMFSSLDDFDIDNTYSISELVEQYDREEVVLVLAYNYEQFCEELFNSDDEIVLTISNHILLMKEMIMYTDSIVCGDSICMEELLNK